MITYEITSLLSYLYFRKSFAVTVGYRNQNRFCHHGSFESPLLACGKILNDSHLWQGRDLCES